MENEILHDKTGMKFYANIQGEEAVLRYAPLPGGDLDFFKTYVPLSLRGKGLAALLMQAGLKYARETGVRIRPTCSYVEQYFEEHPEEITLRA